MAAGDKVFGLHAVEALLRRDPGRVKALEVQQGRDDPRMAALLDRAQAAALPVRRVPRGDLDRACGGGRHQGVLARVAAARAVEERDLPDRVMQAGQEALLLVLDGVTDPHNLGACLRTADAAGASAVIAPRDRAAGLTAVARKVACGAAESVPFVQVTNLARSLDLLKDLGVWVVGTEGEAQDSLYAADLTGPVALVLGAEGRGMRQLTARHCDARVHLPMQGQVESLNVSVAAGVCLYEAVRQRLSRRATAPGA
ncbi:23S rRNA Gm-2251 2'-O-methyltransferase [Ectothiorhodospira mobilis]|uniref:23S rRNA (guanosine-2'-O-)-methyltransferase RlmB n=1 Tax=Ectothiorhodospira mobilis TaxID=195064 RepID=A0A1I4QRU7_ECTMO|nr:23S rRNA (guanosine(2251)-2'-O)-methyltransferase RlmB [Ectothiorhodospira mobilis]SFM42788.1 23S rRNA Gm-2251 2'-O-methyltransferase [Ectothiorhodospira mobilis]